MRKFVISLLLASAVAAPAIAGPRDRSDRQQAHEEHQQAQESRQQVHQERAQVREERVQGAADRPSFAGPSRGQQIQMEQRQEMAARQFGGDGGGRVQPQVQERRGMFGGDRSGQRDAFAAQRQAYVQQQEQQQQQQQQRAFSGDRQQGRDWRQSRSGNYQRNGQQNYQRDQHWNGSGSGDHHWNRDGHSNVRWNRDWRNDRRYDWRRYRDHHRSNFHLGLYIDPFGWGYQSFNIGYQMYPAYYGNQYWIDPGMYGLPYPPAGAAWVRYWNDAVLVDVYTGTVLDVIPSFFW